MKKISMSDKRAAATGPWTSTDVVGPLCADDRYARAVELCALASINTLMKSVASGIDQEPACAYVAYSVWTPRWLADVDAAVQRLAPPGKTHRALVLAPISNWQS